MDYASFVVRISELTAIPASDTDFIAILPACIEYAENRIYRELDLLSTTTTYSSASTIPTNRSFSFPAGTFITLQEVNVASPAGSSLSGGERVPLLPVSKTFLDFVYPSAVVTGTPIYFAMLTDNTILLGPWPDGAYVVEGVGTQRPTALSASNTTTTLSTYFADLMVAAAMVFMAGYQKNYGGQADDPQQGTSWETMYQKLSMGAGIEEARKKFQSTGFSSLSPMPVATPNVGGQ